MSIWNTNMFTAAADDYERAQYVIEGHLHQTMSAFRRNILYPFLSEISQCHASLSRLLNAFEDADSKFPKPIKSVDIDRKRIIHESLPELSRREYVYTRNIARWALPKLTEVIMEGTAVFDFVHAETPLEPVGIIPQYLNEGYLIIPNHRTGTVPIFRYQLSIYTSREERHRPISLSSADLIPDSTGSWEPEEIKAELIERHRDELPNPATFFVDTDLDFPFEETMLPVVKRKLMIDLSERLHGRT